MRQDQKLSTWPPGGSEVFDGDFRLQSRFGSPDRCRSSSLMALVSLGIPGSVLAPLLFSFRQRVSVSFALKSYHLTPTVHLSSMRRMRWNSRTLHGKLYAMRFLLAWMPLATGFLSALPRSPCLPSFAVTGMPNPSLHQNRYSRLRGFRARVSSNVRHGEIQ